VRSFNLPERVGAWQPKLQHWSGLIASGRADDFKETALLPDFLSDIFCGLLGYTGPAESPDTFTFSRERHIELEGKVADAVLGPFEGRVWLAGVGCFAAGSTRNRIRSRPASTPGSP
jgi:hypothetical protein